MKVIIYLVLLLTSDDLSETKSALTEVNRRYHELELDYRRIENEREELAAAYKEAEAVSSLKILFKFVYHYISKPHTYRYIVPTKRQQWF